MLDQLIASYRENIGRGQTPNEASRNVAAAVTQNPEVLPDAFRELAEASLPTLGAVQRQRLTLTAGKPWYDRPELKTWHKIPVPVGNTGRRVLAGEFGKLETRAAGQFILRRGMTEVKLGKALLRAESLMKNGDKLPDVLRKLSGDEQKRIGEYVLSFRAAIA